MKEQYVGDIGDFGKVLLLKCLADSGFRLGVNWMLTANDAGRDGKHRNYHDYRGNDCLCCCDAEVFERLRSIARRSVDQRRINDLEDVVYGFCAKAILYHSKYPSGRIRASLDEDASRRLSDAELVFFDPDNGIAGESGSSEKHIYYRDLARYWERGQSLLVYHHLNRDGSHDSQIDRTKSTLSSRFPGSKIFHFHLRRGTARVYFPCVQPHHDAKVNHERIESAIRPLTKSKREWAQEARSCSHHPSRV